MSDLQLKTQAFVKFDYLTRQNLALMHTAAFMPSLFQIYSNFFHGIVTLIFNQMFEKFDFKK